MTAVDFSQFVDELATLSGSAILPFFRTNLAAQDKNAGGAFDPVTEADKAAEAAMRHLIKRTFPAHGIVGEEYGSENGDAEYVWVLDPIDGTKSFICGLPMWGTLIGLTRNGIPCHGMMHQPFTGERFSGDGKRAIWRGATGKRSLRTRDCSGLSEATLMTTSPLLMSEENRERFRRVEGQARLSRYGGDCYSYCMLAAGFVDVVVETNLKPYDIVAIIPIIEGAGGIVTTWDGKPAQDGGSVVASGSRAVHEATLALLNA